MHHSNDYNVDHSLQIPEILSRPLMKHGRKKILFFAIKYIELHYATLTLPELASFFNYSERQMTRILKNYTGQTLKKPYNITANDISLKYDF